jgi:hypothetical protein
MKNCDYCGFPTGYLSQYGDIMICDQCEILLNSELSALEERDKHKDLRVGDIEMSGIESEANRIHRPEGSKEPLRVVGKSPRFEEYKEEYVQLKLEL